MGKYINIKSTLKFCLQKLETKLKYKELNFIYQNKNYLDHPILVDTQEEKMPA